MAIKYISTATRGNAHKSDILGVSLASKCTVTVSADGVLKLWANASFERELVSELDVDPLGLHHVSVFEDTLTGSGAKVCFIGAVGFSGKFHLISYSTTDGLKKIDFSPEMVTKASSYWAPCFVKDWENGKDHFLAITTVTGATQVFSFDFLEGDEIPTFVHKGEVSANDDSFAVSIDAHASSKKVVIGHQNGSVYLYDLQRLMLLFNFETYGLKQTNKSINIVRSLSFSPNGQLLAIARDSGPYGTVSVHDVKYGEFLGTLTLSTHSSNVGVGSYAHKKWCMAVAFNASGTLIATGGFDNKIRIWDVETRQCEATLQLNTTDISDEDLETSTSLDESACVDLQFVAPGLIDDDGKNDGLIVVGLDRAIRWFREAGGV